MLTGAQGVGAVEAGRAIAAQVGHDHSVALGGEGWSDFVVGAGGVGEAVEQNDRLAGDGAVFLVGEIQAWSQDMLHPRIIVHCTLPPELAYPKSTLCQ
ncbi:hypothetical protein D3C76_1347750 [compost metagenome]